MDVFLLISILRLYTFFFDNDKCQYYGTIKNRQKVYFCLKLYNQKIRIEFIATIKNSNNCTRYRTNPMCGNL